MFLHRKRRPLRRNSKPFFEDIPLIEMARLATLRQTNFSGSGQGTTTTASCQSGTTTTTTVTTANVHGVDTDAVDTICRAQDQDQVTSPNP